MKVFDVESRVTCATFPLVKEHPLPSFSCKRDIVRDREGDGAEEKGEIPLHDCHVGALDVGIVS